MKMCIDITECKNPTDQFDLIVKTLFESKYKREARIYSVIIAKSKESGGLLDLSYGHISSVYRELVGETPPTETEFISAIDNLRRVQVRFYDHNRKLRTASLIN